MTTFGMPYMGSKNTLAPEIIKVLPKGKILYDLFGGGGAITHCALLSNKWDRVRYNDINKMLIPFLDDAICGRFNPKAFITKELFDGLKEKSGYVRYIYSFGNNGRNYLYSKELTPYKEAFHYAVVSGGISPLIKGLLGDEEKFLELNQKERRLFISKKFKGSGHVFNGGLEHLQRIERCQRLQELSTPDMFGNFPAQRLILSSSSYKDFNFNKNEDAAVYCDPPYEGTYGYDKKRKNDFDSKEFYDWVHAQTVPVYFSSYEISDPTFEVVFEQKKRTLMNSYQVTGSKTEKLYWNGIS